MIPRLAFPHFPKRGQGRSTHSPWLWISRRKQQEQTPGPVTVPDKLRVEVSNALRRGRCRSHLSSGPGRGGRAQAVPLPRAPPPVQRAHSVPGSAAAEAGSRAGVPSPSRPLKGEGLRACGTQLRCCSLWRMAARAWAGCCGRCGNKPF